MSLRLLLMTMSQRILILDHHLQSLSMIGMVRGLTHEKSGRGISYIEKESLSSKTV